MRIEVHGDKAGARAAFEARLQAQCDELNVALDRVDGNGAARADAPDVAVMFPRSGHRWTQAEAGDFAWLDGAAHAVLPVIDAAPDAALLPAALKRFNAFQTGLWDKIWDVGLVDEVLSHGWQHRHDRRVFISYRRIDSGPVANQLHEALTRRGYVTFLDDVSIDKGDDFQHELKWWLNDADVVLVLISPNFESSEWCMQEINFAKAGSIGLLGVEWPLSVAPGRATRAFPASTGRPAPATVAAGIDPDQRLRLADGDFTGASPDPLCEQTLNADGLARVLAHCARQRALAIRLRLQNLIPLAERVVKPAGGWAPAGTVGDFTFKDAAGDDFFLRVLPFRPDARSVRDAFLAAGPTSHVGCLYGESDVNDPRAAAMRWLAAGRHDDAQAPRRTRVWACVGDNAAP